MDSTTTAAPPPSSSLPSCRHCIVIIYANSRARALTRALSLARDGALGTALALRPHSRPRLVCARARAADLSRGSACRTAIGHRAVIAPRTLAHARAPL